MKQSQLLRPAGLLAVLALTLPPAQYPLNAGSIVQQAYLKASNTEGGAEWPGTTGDWFGAYVAISGDTVVVGARYEDSNATGVNGNQSDNSAPDSGAAYVFVRTGTTWSQQAYLKASNADAYDEFGPVAIAGDTIVIGAPGEASSAIGVNGDQSDKSAPGSGAAYVFVREGTNWIQQAYLKASNAEAGDAFGRSVAISGDTVLVGANFESSSAPGVNGDQSNNDRSNAGAAYVFVRSGTNWTQQAYLKASNPQESASFGLSVAVCSETVVVGAFGEGNYSGAAYVFARNGTNWAPQAYLKASNAESNDFFGIDVSVSGDIIAVGANSEDSNASGVNGNQNDNSAPYAGAVYIFLRNGDNWTQQAYLKGSNPEYNDQFGGSVSLSGDTLVVGAALESSSATGINGNQNNNNAPISGAAYVFVREGNIWRQQAYLKASNTGGGSPFGDLFGARVSVSGHTAVIGAYFEDSNATGVNGNQANNSAINSGAAYVFTGLGHGPPLTLMSDGTGGYYLRIHGIPDVSYIVQRAPSVTGSWSAIATNIAPVSGVLDYHETAAPPGSAYYRTIQP